jgi:hypothetical protein
MPNIGRTRSGHGSGQFLRHAHNQLAYTFSTLSLERLEEYARDLAASHKAITRRVPAKPLLAKAEKSSRILEDAYTQLADLPGQNQVLMPGDEWLLDNYHIVRDTLVVLAALVSRRPANRAA